MCTVEIITCWVGLCNSPIEERRLHISRQFTPLICDKKVEKHHFIRQGNGDAVSSIPAFLGLVYGR
ncbi:hypothetical protein M413DRAFT_298607 [Hebeloma cylindrosporum]|uniref:Uncharacterized protein n=1 Tax=Hebeloma cylindrosporum TaxID=76867 RepID=A0A0C3CPY8_HEBCY|nr:hypothetical protein M413DRAFT_298607 [Hebeloma cylindrosporum h7]